MKAIRRDDLNAGGIWHDAAHAAEMVEVRVRVDHGAHGRVADACGARARGRRTAVSALESGSTMMRPVSPTTIVMFETSKPRT
jgi:hypothetical protein